MVGLVDRMNDEIMRIVCQQHNQPFAPPKAGAKLGIAANVRSGALPINGLRHPPTDETCGWYIWAGEELSDDPDFFLPLHVEHIDEWAPTVAKFLGLPPGWRFLIAGEYEDVWEDLSLLQHDSK